MKIELEEAQSLKRALKYLNEIPDGMFLMEFLEELCGKFSPTYNPENQASIVLSAGRTEVIQTLRNLDRLTDEQIVAYYEG